MQNLQEIVERYGTLAEKFGEPVALSAFALSADETQAVFSSLDEDYQISRYLQFFGAEGESYVVSGQAITHVAIDPAIHAIL